MIKKLSIPFLFGFLVLLSSCESTGICTEPITPKFMVAFFAKDNLGNNVKVDPPKNLKIFGNRDGKDLIGGTPENEYIYPNLFQTDEAKRVTLLFDVNRDSLIYIFRYDGNIHDTLKLKYSRKNSYVSENCGYKTIFKNININYTTNAIDTIILLSDNIEFDNEEHIEIFNK
jgi:hypothetical protein